MVQGMALVLVAAATVCNSVTLVILMRKGKEDA